MNFLLINADQLRHDCVGYRGLRGVKTPNIDRLAAQGTVYDRAFAPLPVCSPARQAWLCGRHPDSFGAQWNFDFAPTPTVKPEWCWPVQLEKRGYQTGYVGNFHVSPEHDATLFGYQKHVRQADYAPYIREKYPTLAYHEGWLGETSPLPVEDALTHWAARQAAEMVTEFAKAGKPWHVWMDFADPHLPCHPCEPFASQYDPKDIEPWVGFDDPFVGKPYCHKQQTVSWEMDGKTWDEIAPMVARYYALVSQLDDAVGMILRALEESGQANDTLVVFTSDHGDMCGSHRMLDKHYVLYDDITRVPLIVRAPGRGHFETDSFVLNALDLPATVVRLLGLDIPSVEHGRPLPLCKEEDASPREHVVCTSNGQQFGLYTTRMIRDGRWKYVWNLTDTDELYDLEADPGELVNRISAAAHASRVENMRKLLYEDLASHNDPFVRSEWTKRQLLEGRKH